MPGRNSSGAEAATRCYNAEELLYDFVIIIIRNTSRGLLTDMCSKSHKLRLIRLDIVLFTALSEVLLMYFLLL